MTVTKMLREIAAGAFTIEMVTNGFISVGFGFCVAAASTVLERDFPGLDGAVCAFAVCVRLALIEPEAKR